jgi:sugar phosphate isomerase/epimerase
MRIGIIDYLLRARDTLVPHLARELGFDSVELAIDQFGDPSRLIFDPERSEDFPYLTKAAGINICSISAITFLSQDLLDTDPVRRRPTSLVVKGLLEKACAVGADVVVLPLLGASEVRSDDQLVALTELLPIWTRWAESLDLAIALKTSLYAEQILRMIDDLPVPRIGISFDPALSAAIGRNPLEEWNKLASRVLHIHLQDRSRSGLATPLGDGEAPLADIVQAIVRSDYAGTLVLSTPAGDHPKENARRNRVYLERLLTLAHQAKRQQTNPPAEPLVVPKAG